MRERIKCRQCVFFASSGNHLSALGGSRDEKSWRALTSSMEKPCWLSKFSSGIAPQLTILWSLTSWGREKHTQKKAKQLRLSSLRVTFHGSANGLESSDIAFIFKFDYFILWVLMHVCYTWMSGERVKCPGTGYIYTVMNLHVGTRNPSRVLWKNSRAWNYWVPSLAHRYLL